MIPIAIAAWLFALEPNVNARTIVVLLGVSTWGVRLTWNWARGWPHIRHEDWRYVDIRKKTCSMGSRHS